MHEYIDREALKNAVIRNCDMQDLYLPVHFLDIVDDMPAADVVPVVHGHWEEKEVFATKGNVDELQSAYCSVCRRYHTTPYLYYFTNYLYCPLCGARMDGAE